jgi:radical SAM protein with 4Fe4S-binding SPASM domain|tara:strand:+ start:3276 stop:4619 length:1344 start_codon:yes stop_codon:yes gene_type:complete
MSKICVYPWSHVNINPQGDVWPCCHQRKVPTVLGNVKTQSMEEIFNGEEIRKLRLDMLNGVLPSPTCDKCVQYEEMGFSSPRLHANDQSWATEVWKSINSTKPDGTVDDYKIKYWDLRWSNICNMNCVMCDPEWSSLWTQDIKKRLSDYDEETIQKDIMLKTWKNRVEEVSGKIRTVPHKDFIDQHIDEVEHIYFAGGEPLIMDEHWYILKRLVENKRFDVKIKYNTNMLKIDYKGESAIDYWKHWSYQNMSIEASIDETGPRAEWIRSGTVWSKVHENIKAVKDANIRISCNASIGAYNVIRLPELVDELWELTERKVNLNPVMNQWCCIQILPDDIKLDIKQKILDWFNPDITKNNLHPRVKAIPAIIKELEKPHNPMNLTSFFKRAAFLDLNKSTTLFDHIPWFEELNNASGNDYERFRDDFIEKSISKRNSSIDSNLCSSISN